MANLKVPSQQYRLDAGIALAELAERSDTMFQTLFDALKNGQFIVKATQITDGWTAAKVATRVSLKI